MFHIYYIQGLWYVLHFFIVCCVVKVANSLTKELTSQFPTSYLMDVMGVMYPQYWLQVDVDFFSKALHVVENTLLL
jgi:hypothetical protein